MARKNYSLFVLVGYHPEAPDEPYTIYASSQKRWGLSVAQSTGFMGQSHERYPLLVNAIGSDAMERLKAEAKAAYQQEVDRLYRRYLVSSRTDVDHTLVGTLLRAQHRRRRFDAYERFRITKHQHHALTDR